MSRYIPPAAPGALLPPVPPALDPPAPPTGELPGWGAFAGPVVLGAALGWGAVQVLAGGWDAGWVLFWAGGGVGLMAWRVVWLWEVRARLLAAQSAYQAALEQYWADSLAARRAAYAGQLGALTRWTEQVLGRRSAEPAPLVNPAQYWERVLAPMHERLDGLAAQLEAREERARVVPPAADDAPPEQTTRVLDPAAQLRAAYEAGPTRTLIRAAWRGDSIANNKLAPRLMSDDAWRTLTPLLADAGVLEGGGERRPYRLAEPYRLPTEEAAHAAVVARLAAVGCAPGALPGDLQTA